MPIYEHTSGGKYLFVNCYELYNTQIELHQHTCVIKQRNTKQVKENNFKCEICGKSLSTKSLLQQHIRCVHEKIKNYKCTHCDYAAGQQFTLTVHINTHHTNKTYRCRYMRCAVKKTSQEELYIT